MCCWIAPFSSQPHFLDWMGWVDCDFEERSSFRGLRMLLRKARRMAVVRVGLVGCSVAYRTVLAFVIGITGRGSVLRFQQKASLLQAY